MRYTDRKAIVENTHLSVKTNVWLLFRIVYLAFILIIVLVCSLTLISISIVKIIIRELCQRLLQYLFRMKMILFVWLRLGVISWLIPKTEITIFSILESKTIILLYTVIWAIQQHLIGMNDRINPL